MSDRLNPGQKLLRGEALVSSNGKYSLNLQDDGNLVLYDDQQKALWSSGTANIAIKEGIMQTDGNFVLYRYDGVSAWNSKTDTSPGGFIIIQDDGNLVIYYDPNPRSVWASNTSQ